MKYVFINTTITLFLIGMYHFYSVYGTGSVISGIPDKTIPSPTSKLQTSDFLIQGQSKPEVVRQDLPTDDLYTVDALTVEQRAEYEENADLVNRQYQNSQGR